VCYNAGVDHAQGRESGAVQAPMTKPHDGSRPDPCVLLWHPEGRPESPLLAEALSKRNLPIRRVTDPYAALALACRIHGPVGGGPAATPVALVLSDREQLRRVEEVLAGLDRHAPLAVVWSFEDGGGKPALKPVVRKKPDIPSEPTVVVRPGGGLGPDGHRAAARSNGSPDALDRLAAPSLRLTDAVEPVLADRERDPAENAGSVPGVEPETDAPERPESSADAADKEDAGDAGTSLSDEELDMLLGDTGTGPARPGSA